MAGVKREVWTREVERRLNYADQGGFLDGIRDQSAYVQPGDEAETIHSTFFGVKPDVLVNNTTYPLAVQDLNGTDFTLQLDKFQTKATPITDDELYALAYDKMVNVTQSHSEAISELKFDKAIHALAPNSNTAGTPVLLTTGADDGSGRKRLTAADVIRLKKAFDDALFPQTGRRLVLCGDHISDLLTGNDQKFAQQYYNYTTGKIANLYGFEVYEYVNPPYFVPSTKTKKSFGAVPAGTDRRASVAFITSKAIKAQGSTKMYYSPANLDPLMQRSLVNFRHYYIVLPSALNCIGAIVSDNV